MRTLLALLLLLASLPACAADPDSASFAFDPKLGAQLPPDALVRDEQGRAVTLGTVMGGAPLVLAPGYFRCPNLCGIVLADLFQALSRTGLVAGRDYSLLALSIDPAEAPPDAAAARARDLAAIPFAGAESGVRFLTGDEAAIKAVGDAVGFRSRFDAGQKQFLHPAGLVFLTPQGRVSGYLLGVGYTADEVRRALVTAGQETVAPASPPIVLLCFHYDPATGRYTLAVTRLLQLAAGITVLTIGGALWHALRRERAAGP